MILNARDARLRLPFALAVGVAGGAKGASARAGQPRLSLPEGTADNWRVGLHYGTLIPPIRTLASPGKIEVRVPFLYTYGRALDNEFLGAWTAKKPDDVEVVLAPDIRWAHARVQARIYFTLLAIGRSDLHDKLYDWIWQKEHYPIYHNLLYPDERAIFDLTLVFCRSQGVSEAAFTDAYYSKRMNDRVLNAEFEAQSAGFSQIVVNGLYTTVPRRLVYVDSYPNRRDPKKEEAPETFARLYRLIDFLIAAERRRLREL
jgi:hypothetical protein